MNHHPPNQPAANGQPPEDWSLFHIFSFATESEIRRIREILQVATHRQAHHILQAIRQQDAIMRAEYGRGPPPPAAPINPPPPNPVPLPPPYPVHRPIPVQGHLNRPHGNQNPTNAPVRPQLHLNQPPDLQLHPPNGNQAMAPESHEPSHTPAGGGINGLPNSGIPTVAHATASPGIHTPPTHSPRSGPSNTASHSDAVTSSSLEPAVLTGQPHLDAIEAIVFRSSGEPVTIADVSKNQKTGNASNRKTKHALNLRPGDAAPDSSSLPSTSAASELPNATMDAPSSSQLRATIDTGTLNVDGDVTAGSSSNAGPTNGAIQLCTLPGTSDVVDTVVDLDGSDSDYHQNSTSSSANRVPDNNLSKDSIQPSSHSGNAAARNASSPTSPQSVVPAPHVFPRPWTHTYDFSAREDVIFKLHRKDVEQFVKEASRNLPILPTAGTEEFTELHTQLNEYVRSRKVYEATNLPFVTDFLYYSGNHEEFPVAVEKIPSLKQMFRRFCYFYDKSQEDVQKMEKERKEKADEYWYIQQDLATLLDEQANQIANGWIYVKEREKRAPRKRRTAEIDYDFKNRSRLEEFAESEDEMVPGPSQKRRYEDVRSYSRELGIEDEDMVNGDGVDNGDMQEVEEEEDVQDEEIDEMA